MKKFNFTTAIRKHSLARICLPLVLAMFSTGCSRQWSIRHDLANDRSDRVIAYVQNNIGNPDASKNIDFAMNEAIKRNATPLIRTFEGIGLDNDAPNLTREYVLDSFAENRCMFSDAPRLLNEAYATQSDGVLSAPLYKLARLLPFGDRLSFISEKLALLDGSGDRPSGIGADLKTLNFAIVILPNQLHTINELQSSLHAVNDTWDQIDSLNKQLSEMQTDIEKMDREAPLQMLHGYVVRGIDFRSQVGMISYEVVTDIGEHVVLASPTRYSPGAIINIPTGLLWEGSDSTKYLVDLSDDNGAIQRKRDQSRVKVQQLTNTIRVKMGAADALASAFNTNLCATFMHCENTAKPQATPITGTNATETATM